MKLYSLQELLFYPEIHIVGDDLLEFVTVNLKLILKQSELDIPRESTVKMTMTIHCHHTGLGMRWSCRAVPTNGVSCGYLFIAKGFPHTHTPTHTQTDTHTHATMYTSTHCQTIQLATIQSIGVITQRLLSCFLPAHYHSCNYAKVTAYCHRSVSKDDRRSAEMIENRSIRY